MSEAEKITLFSTENPDVKIFMQLILNKKGQLIFDGYDTGSLVKKTFGPFDYEYSFSVESAEVAKFYRLLNIPTDSKKDLLNRLKEMFGFNDGFSKMKEFMTNNGIKYQTFFWH